MLLAFLACFLGLVFTTQSFAQTGFMKYTIDGVNYSFNDKQVQCYQKEGYKDTDDKVAFMETKGFLKFNVESQNKLGIKIRVEKGKKLTVGKYTIQDLLSQTKILPNVYLSLENETNDGLVIFGTEKPENGVFEITKIDGVWIEGIFEVEIPNNFEDESSVLKVTNGSFRLKLTKF